jgi:hypothetical protein
MQIGYAPVFHDIPNTFMEAVIVATRSLYSYKIMKVSLSSVPIQGVKTALCILTAQVYSSAVTLIKEGDCVGPTAAGRGDKYIFTARVMLSQFSLKIIT